MSILRNKMFNLFLENLVPNAETSFFFRLFFLLIIKFVIPFVSSEKRSLLSEHFRNPRNVPQHHHSSTTEQKHDQNTQRSNINQNQQQVADFYPSITRVSQLYACGGDICEKISEFQIVDNHTLNCHDNYIAIKFLITDSENEGKKIVSHGFLPQIGETEILTTQLVTDLCKRIKR